MRPELPIRAAVFGFLLVAAACAEARWYQVEVVVFRHDGALTAGGEHWSEPDSLPDFGSAVSLITEQTEDSAGTGTQMEVDALLPFRELPRGERALAGVERRLRRSAAYEPLLSTAWRQPSYGVSRARRVYLSDLPEPGVAAIEDGQVEPQPLVDLTQQRRVEGLLAIKVSRLLHVDLDFLYYLDGLPVRLTETRKLKLREIHYFDHPLFGIIVQVSPWVPPSNDTDETGSAGESSGDDDEAA